MYQMNQTELSSLECGIRICLQADAGVVFFKFPLRETLFYFPFPFGVREIANSKCSCSLIHDLFYSKEVPNYCDYIYYFVFYKI